MSVFSGSVFKDTVFKVIDSVTITSTGGFDEYSYKKYRKYLHELQRVTEQRDAKKYQRKVVAVSKKLETAPQAVVSKVADIIVPTMSVEAIDFHKTAVDLQRVIAYLDDRIKFLMLERQQNQFEEEFLLLSIV